MTGASSVPNADVPERGVRVRASLPEDTQRTRWSAALSVLVHVLLIAFAIRVGFEAADERGNPMLDFDQLPGGGGGGGTGGAGYVTVLPPPPPPPPAITETAPTVVPTEIPPPEVEPEEDPEPVPPPPAPTPPAGNPGGTQGTGGGSGGGQGTGTGPGTGSGVGPGSGGGSGGGTGGGGQRGRPPESRAMILPPIDNVPRSLRGKSVEVTFHIDATGVVTALEVVPPIADRGYARKFDEAMRGYRFRPARDADNRAVAGLLVMTVNFPGR